MRNDQECTSLPEPSQRPLNLYLAVWIGVRGGLVQYNNGRILEDGTSNGDALQFTSGEMPVGRADHRVISLWQCTDAIVDLGVAGGALDLRVCRLWSAQSNVLPHRVCEQNGFLENYRDSAKKFRGGNLPDIHPTVCRSGRISMLQVLERTLPDSGSGLAEWWATHGTQNSSWASVTYAELIDRAGPAGERHATTLSLSLDMRAAARQIRTAGGGVRGAAAVLRQEMSTLVAALRSADLSPSAWLSCGQIAVILRSAYDPAVAASLERHGELGQSLATAGPVAVNESWSGLRTDSAHHAVLWVSEWPRSMVYPGFLAPLLLSTGIQRSFSLLCTPMRSDQAARDIRKKKTEYISDAHQRQRIGQIEDASQTAEFHDVLQQEADLTAGHGVLRYTGLISVSAVSADELDAAVAAVEQAAIQASCETRLLVGQQAQAFTAAALPLCRSV